MKTAKKSPLEKIFIVSSSDGLECARETFIDAEIEAKGMCEDGKEDIRILEVTKIWNVYFPEEPDPETHKITLEDLDL